MKKPKVLRMTDFKEATVYPYRSSSAPVFSATHKAVKVLNLYRGLGVASIIAVAAVVVLFAPLVVQQFVLITVLLLSGVVGFVLALSFVVGTYLEAKSTVDNARKYGVIDD